MGVSHPGYCGNLGITNVTTASGLIQRHILGIRAILRRDQQTMGTWFTETVCIVPDEATLLSGSAVRDQFYFATPKGNDMLIVGINENLGGHDLIRLLGLILPSRPLPPPNLPSSPTCPKPFFPSRWSFPRRNVTAARCMKIHQSTRQQTERSKVAPARAESDCPVPVRLAVPNAESGK
jgi:hypothetical protein